MTEENAGSKTTFNLDKMLDALDRPKVTLEGEEVVGMWPSLPSFMRFVKAMSELDFAGDVEVASEHFIEVCRVLLNEMKLPGDKMAELPFEVLWEVMEGFLVRMQAEMFKAPGLRSLTEKGMTAEELQEETEAAMESLGMSNPEPMPSSSESGSASSEA